MCFQNFDSEKIEGKQNIFEFYNKENRVCQKKCICIRLCLIGENKSQPLKVKPTRTASCILPHPMFLAKDKGRQTGRKATARGANLGQTSRGNNHFLGVMTYFYIDKGRGATKSEGPLLGMTQSSEQMGADCSGRSQHGARGENVPSLSSKVLPHW